MGRSLRKNDESDLIVHDLNARTVAEIKSRAMEFFGGGGLAAGGARS
jgi:hypothetical protein